MLHSKCTATIYPNLDAVTHLAMIDRYSHATENVTYILDICRVEEISATTYVFSEVYTKQLWKCMRNSSYDFSQLAALSSRCLSGFFLFVIQTTGKPHKVVVESCSPAQWQMCSQTAITEKYTNDYFVVVFKSLCAQSALKCVVLATPKTNGSKNAIRKCILVHP